MALIIVLARRIVDPPRGAAPRFDLVGAILSAAGLFFVVLGILQCSTYGWTAARTDFSIAGTVVIPKGGISPVWLFVAIGAVFLGWFFLHIRAMEQAGKDPLLSPRLFRNRTSNLGLVTQNIQWLTMQGTFFVVSVFLQQIRGYNAIQTGLMLTPSTIGVLARLAPPPGGWPGQRSQRCLIRAASWRPPWASRCCWRWSASSRASGPSCRACCSSVSVSASCSPRRSTSCSRPSPRRTRATSPACPAACRTWAPRWARPWPARSWSAPASPGGKPFALALATMGVFVLLGLLAAAFIPTTPPAVAEAGPGALAAT